jgi:CMP-N-acetylneuraminic acid synthetase
MNRIAIILARSGSKRIPNKNLLKINGKTLTQLAVECALKNNLMTILSSDSSEILNQEFKELPLLYRRSAESASDEATSEAGVLEIIEDFGFENQQEVILLPPTSPTRNEHHLRSFLLSWDALASLKDYNQAISVVENRQDFWMNKETGAIRIRNLLNAVNEPRRTQDRTPWYLETSAIYLSNIGELRRTKSFVSSRVALIPLDPITALDIDNMSDYELARLLLESANHD